MLNLGKIDLEQVYNIIKKSQKNHADELHLLTIKWLLSISDAAAIVNEQALAKELFNFRMKFLNSKHDDLSSNESTIPSTSAIEINLPNNNLKPLVNIGITDTKQCKSIIEHPSPSVLPNEINLVNIDIKDTKQCESIINSWRIEHPSPNILPSDGVVLINYRFAANNIIEQIGTIYLYQVENIHLWMKFEKIKQEDNKAIILKSSLKKLWFEFKQWIKYSPIDISFISDSNKIISNRKEILNMFEILERYIFRETIRIDQLHQGVGYFYQILINDGGQNQETPFYYLREQLNFYLIILFEEKPNIQRERLGMEQQGRKIGIIENVNFLNLNLNECKKFFPEVKFTEGEVIYWIKPIWKGNMNWFEESIEIEEKGLCIVMSNS